VSNFSKMSSETIWITDYLALITTAHQSLMFLLEASDFFYGVLSFQVLMCRFRQKQTQISGLNPR